MKRFDNKSTSGVGAAGMRNANWTRVLTILLSLLALYALLAVLAGFVQRFITPLLLLILASIIAFVLTPVVDLIQRTLHLFRWLSILITYLLLVCVLGSLGYFMTTPLIDQTKALTAAIKNPTTQNLHELAALEATANTYLKQVQVYQNNTSQTKVDPATGLPTCLPTSGPCAPAPCYAAYFLGYTGYSGDTHHPGSPTPIWVGSGCIRPNSGAAIADSPGPGPQNWVWYFWRYGSGTPANPLGIQQPFKVMRPIAGRLLQKLSQELNQLGKSSVRPPGTGHPHAPIPTTQVPSSYAKPVKKALATLTSAVNVAVSAVQRTANTYPTDSTRILKAAQTLDAQVKALYHKVKTTPIIVMATQNFFDQHHISVNVGSAISSAINKARGQSTTVLNNAVSILTGTLNAIFDGIVVLIMSLYLLADGGRFIGWIISLVPEDHREQAWFFVNSLNRVLGGYIRGQLIVAITIGILAGVGCWVIGVPYALLLGIFAFLAESIPVMGPIIASVPAILVALFTLPLLKVIIVVGWFIVIQQIEQNVVGPRITGHAVGIHPVVAMVAVILGLEIGGIWGAFLAVPVTGILFVVVGEGYRYVILRRPLPTAEVPSSLEVEAPSPEGGGRNAAS